MRQLSIDFRTFKRLGAILAILLCLLGIGLSSKTFAQDPPTGGGGGAAASTGEVLPGPKPPPEISPADSAWVSVSAALVLLMTPGLALFYGGMVRRKNVLSTFLHSFVMLGVIPVVWLLLTYSLAFGKGSPYIGGVEFMLGEGISMKASYPYAQHTIPAGLFMLFQMMFAIITPALISGAIAERMKFSGYVMFSVLWSVVVYAPVACWVWNPEGWLFKKGVLDFAGGTVVHLASGASALAACLVLGKRKAIASKEPVLPNNLTTTLLGAGLLWFGWIGFNAGSALAMNDVAISAFTSTHVAAATGMLGWLICEKIRYGKATALGAASGLVAGLVGITPAAGYVTPVSGLIIGFIVGIVCCLAVGLKHKMGFDDALDVVGVHGVGGALGAILTGVFADFEVNSAVADALQANGNSRTGLVMAQLTGIAVVAIFAFVATIVLMKITQAFVGIRTSDDEENLGLDLTLHGEAGYNL